LIDIYAFTDIESGLTTNDWIRVEHLEVLGSRRLLVLLAGLLGRGGSLGLGRLRDKDGVDVRENTTLGNGNTAEQLVQLLVVADSQQDVARDDAGLLVVAGSVTSQLKDLSSEVLKDGSEVNRSTSTNARSILALLQEAGDTANRELKTSLGGLRLALLAISLSTAALAALTSTSCRSSLSLSRHFD
jgi:hypothetical protein